MKVVSVVPIKLNNERLPGKNIKNLGNRPLVQYIFETLLGCNYIDENYVYCSDKRIIEYVPEEVKFLKRPKKLDEADSNFTQIFECFCHEIQADIYVYAHATAPYITKKSIEVCIKNVLTGKFDSAFTATKIQDFLWMDGKPLNFDAKNLPRSQDLVPVYRESSGIYVFTADVFDKIRSINR